MKPKPPRKAKLTKIEKLIGRAEPPTWDNHPGLTREDFVKTFTELYGRPPSEKTLIEKFGVTK